MTEKEQSPWEKCTARYLATPQQKMRGWLILWIICLILAPVIIGQRGTIGPRLYMIGAVFGWIPALVIFVRQRKAAQELDTKGQP